MKNINYKPFLTKLLLMALFFFILSVFEYPQQTYEETEILSVTSLSVKSSGANIKIGAIVTDSEGSPLPGVTVFFVDSKGIMHTRITDENGRFGILIPKESLTQQIEAKFELAGFKTQTMNIDLPYPPSTPPEPEEPPIAPPAPLPPPACDVQEVILKNGHGIAFANGKIIQDIETESYDIYFKSDKFYVKRKEGGIATVGNQGNKILCDINYPVYGYCDYIRIRKKWVYLYESHDENIRAEIRVKSFKKSEEVEISYHVRIE